MSEKLTAIYLPKDPETGLVTSEQMSSVDDADDSEYEGRRKAFIDKNFGGEVLSTIYFHETLGVMSPVSILQLLRMVLMIRVGQTMNSWILVVKILVQG